MKRINISSLLIAVLLVIGVLISTLPDAAADTPEIWKLTGSMATSRRSAHREVLPDGRILVVGGTNTTGVDGAASVFYDSAEIYDPATGTWTATGGLTTGGRALHALARLPDGKVLVTGGWNGSAALSSAEIYDPATGTWSATDSMGTARANHRDQVLFDGRILITGGFDSLGNPLASAEIYTYNTQTGTGTFSATNGSMLSARFGHRMNNVGEDEVLVTGGFGAGGVALASSELFNPASGGSFTAPGSASLAHARGHHYATTLPTGEILVSGGHSGSSVLDSTELYDPDTGTFTAGATLNQARQSHSSVLLPNGLVLISGGNTSSSTDWDIQTHFLSSAELYDRATNSFTPTGSKNNATTGASSILLWTGKFLVAGGGTNQAELYNPEMPGTSETWVATTGNLPAARTSHQQNLLDDGRVLMTGGLPDSTGASTPLKSAVLYDYLTGNFNSTGDMSIERQQHRTALLYTGKVLVTGGRATASSGVLNSAELYDPVSGTFTLTGNMVRSRRNHRATNLPNGKILITGGQGGSGVLQSIAELYDPATGTFTQTTGGLATARRSHQATLLYTGKVLVAGGTGDAGVLNSAELYNPDTNNFTVTGAMITARNSPSLTRLANGKVLVVGGTDAGGSPVQAVELYDPATGTFTAAGNMSVGRDGNRVSRLDSGRVLIVGGQTTAIATDVTDTAELFNHVTGTFAATDNLITGRQDFAQTSLPNGRILAAGGIDATGVALSSAELYTPLIGDLVDTTITSGPTAARGGATNSTTAVFNFTSTDLTATFACSLDGAAFTACTTGKSFTKLKVGAHNFKVQATAGGITDSTPERFDWTIDKKAPNTTITSAPGPLTNNPVATVIFTSTEAGGGFQCSLDGSPFADCNSPFVSGALADGKHNFQVKAVDAAGNLDKSAAKAKAWTVDTTRPITTITGKPTDPTTSTSATFKFTSEKKSTFQCSLDGGAFTPCKSGQKYSGLLPGPHNFQVQATDPAGNDELTPASYSWTQN